MTRKTISASTDSFHSITADSPCSPLLLKLRELAELPEGWQYGEGIPPLEQVIQTAEEIYNKLSFFQFQVDAFPGLDGSLSLVFYSDQRCVEIDISQDGKLNLSMEDGKGYEYEEIESIPDASFQDVMNQVTHLDGNTQLWNSLGYSTLDILIDNPDVSEAHVLQTQVTGQVYQLWKFNAFESDQRPLANT